MKKRITISLDAELLETISAACRADNRSISNAIESVLMVWLSMERLKQKITNEKI